MHNVALKNIKDTEVKGKRVLVRLDLNVPVKDHVILDDARLRATIPTLKDLMQRGAKVILMSHFGRPSGRDPALSLSFLVEPMGTLLGTKVAFCRETTGQDAAAQVRAMLSGEVLLLENARFDPREEANDMDFARELAALGDFYVNDAFSVSHRAHASVEAIAHLLPAFGGTCLVREVDALTKALAAPTRPLCAVVAGSKISTKLALLENLIQKVDILMLGGGIANTFLRAQGFGMGGSLVEMSMLGTARDVMEKARARGCQIVLPQDAVVALDTAGTNVRTCALEDIAPEEKMFDIGPLSVATFSSFLDKSATLVWNGPLGVFETPPFHKGTVALAREAARLTQMGSLFSIGGGGETVAALSQAGAANLFSYISLAGGAFLEFLEGKELPGISALAQSAQEAMSKSL
ncbi:MAG: phosphoglycerate kinase [Candidatus Puniceispirillum sp.]|nr:phosphoglycerate kinase [Candidatus Puniceispirillum sp.]